MRNALLNVMKVKMLEPQIAKWADDFEQAMAALAAGKTALVLVPEIGLTPQMTGRLVAAFGAQVDFGRIPAPGAA